MDTQAGVYLHIPFCKRKCNYCAFVSYCNTERIEAYADALIEEIRSRGDGSTVSTVYVGGGTPSLLTSEQVARIMTAVREAHAVTQDAEITIEVNPESVTEEWAKACLQAGVNRVSVGVQSFSDEVLRKAGRLHNGETALKAIEILQKVGFSNISADLIIGLPSQTATQLYQDVTRLALSGVTHVSVYGLSVEEGTPFSQNGVTADDDEEAIRYENAVKLLQKYGFLRYEVSNFAMDGYESRHNVKYWFGVPYYGYGVAAHSLVRGERLENTSDLDAYLQGAKEKTRITLTHDDERLEALIFPLRTKWGVDLASYEKRFGVDLTKSKAVELARLKDFLTVREGKLLLTDRGYYVQDAVLAQLTN